MDSPFLLFSVLFGLAVVGGLIMRMVRLPTLLGYVLVGLLFGRLTVGNQTMESLILLLSSAGVMLLLFLVGLEMNVSIVRELGKRVLIVGLGQLVISFAVFGLILFGLGYGGTTLFVMALALAFSSTIVVIRILSERHELETTHGKMVVGVLLVQDLAAIALLLLMSDGVSSLGLLLTKSVVLILLSIFISVRVMPVVMHKLAKSTDELVLFSLAWCFVVAALVSTKTIGLSLEVGGFLAGLALSGSFEHLHIVNKIKPIRDFFLTLFFVSLGLSLKLDVRVLTSALVLTLAILLFKPLIVWFLMRAVGYKQKAAFTSGLMMGQVSEFSFIVLALVSRFGYVSELRIAELSMAGIISIVLSNILISKDQAIYKVIRPILNLIYKDRGEPESVASTLKDHIILFGCHRMGQSVLVNLEKQGELTVIVDHDPEVVEKLRGLGKTVFFGDVTDVDCLSQIGLSSAKMVISTVRDTKDSLLLLSEMKKRRLSIPVVVDAESREDASDLYLAGAAYVIFPHFVSGLHLGDIIRRKLTSKEDFLIFKNKQEEAMNGTYV